MFWLALGYFRLLLRRTLKFGPPCLAVKSGFHTNSSEDYVPMLCMSGSLPGDSKSLLARSTLFTPGHWPLYALSRKRQGWEFQLSMSGRILIPDIFTNKSAWNASD